MRPATIHSFVCTALLTTGCETVSTPTGDRPKTLPRRELQASAGVRDSLARQRRHFLQSGDPEAVFAVFYYHVTAAILTQEEEGRIPHSRILLELLREFHAAYLRSRPPVTRKNHWQP